MSQDQLSLPELDLEEIEDETYTVTEPTVLTSVSVEKLFGRYSYDIPGKSLEAFWNEKRRLILLYGDNGSGKTTLLSLIYHLLSTGQKHGHRSAVARTPFQRVRIEFSNGMRVEAQRPEGIVEGDYSVSIKSGHTTLAAVTYIPDSSGRVSPPAPPISQLDEEVRGYLDALQLNAYYLTEDRTMLSDDLDDGDKLESVSYVSTEIESRFRASLLEDVRRGRISRLVYQQQELELAINRAENYLRQAAFGGGRRGSAGVNSVYLDVVTKIAESGEDTDTQGDRSKLLQRLRDLGRRSKEFASFGLVVPLVNQHFIDVVERTPAHRLGLVEDVLNPHLNSLQAQLEALEPAYKLISEFVSAVNSFLNDKTLGYTYAVRQALRITTDEGHKLTPPMLSSGERQLLLLFCNVLVARDKTRLFIIDEPEISLNIKWQRKFLDALLDITEGTQMQFLVATHSFEMLAAHRESISRLVGKDEQ